MGAVFTGFTVGRRIYGSLYGEYKMFGLGGMATKWAGHAFFCGVYFFLANKQAPNIFAHKNGVHCGAWLRRLHTRAVGPGAHCVA